MRNIQNKKLHNRKKMIIKLSLFLVVFVLLAFATYAVAAKQFGWTTFLPFLNDITQSSTSEVKNKTTNQVDYSGPSQSDTNNSQSGKQKNDTAKNEVNQPQDAKNVSVAISFADIVNQNVEIRAFIPNIIEGNGKCTATLKMMNNILERTSDAFIDTSSTLCQPIYIPVSESIQRGEWTLEVTYVSHGYTGKSEIIKVQI